MVDCVTTLVVDKKTGELRPCKRCKDSLRCAHHPRDSDATDSSPSFGDGSGSSSSRRSALVRSARGRSDGERATVQIVDRRRSGDSDSGAREDAGPSARERKVERKTRTRVSPPKVVPATAAAAAAPTGFDALPSEIQTLLLSRLTADELELVTAASANARHLVAANERRCATGNRRCSNYWRDEFERTRLAAVRATPEYRAYVAGLPDGDEKTLLEADVGKPASSDDTVQNALCRLGCEQRATAAVERFVRRVFAEPYPVRFALLRDWPRRGLREIAFTLVRRGDVAATAPPGEYALVVGLVWDAPRPRQVVNRAEYDATVAYLKTDAVAGIADAEFRVETGVAPWYVDAAKRYMLAPTFECVYAGPATTATAHRIAQVLVNIVFTFGDSLTMYADHSKRVGAYGIKQDVLQTRFATDATAFAGAVSNAFERLPVTFWNPARDVVAGLRKLIGAGRANWTFASANPASALYSAEHILAPLRAIPLARHES